MIRALLCAASLLLGEASSQSIRTERDLLSLELPQEDEGRQLTTTASFSLDLGVKNVWFSAAAYCGVNTVKTMTFKGPTTGFKVTYTFDDNLDTQGYVGYLPSDTSIYIVYRGSSNIQNWMTNFQVANIKYTPRCCGKDCTVHKGFYKAEQAVFPGILNEVKRLQRLYPTYKVRLTGHSLGGALAMITANDLKLNNIGSHVYTFGMPRAGDNIFSDCASTLFPHVRVTHLKDMVPHIPFESWEYKHGYREAYEMTTTSVNPSVKNCSPTNGEDTTCSAQWEFKDTNVDDHLIYLGLPISDCNMVK